MEVNSDKPEKISKSKAIKKVLAKYAGYCTICGISLIHEAKTKARTAFWILVFLIMSGFLAFHLYYLTQEYLKFEFSTKVVSDSKELPFPSVTFCNLNPLMTFKIENIKITNNNTRFKALKQFILQVKKDSNRSVKSMDADSNIEFDKDYIPLNPIPPGEEEDSDDKIWNQYYHHLGSLSIQERKSLGHPLKNLLLSCSYNGYKCTEDEFEWTYSTEYVNCWTYNSALRRTHPLTTFHSGSGYGLKLKLFADTDEYLAGLVSAAGFRIAIHPFGTKPFPGDAGFSISTGQETKLALTYQNFTRLNEPYKACVIGKEFVKAYNQTHTLRACQLTCKDKLVIDKCKCKLGHRYEFIPEKVWKEKPTCRGKKLECASKTYAAALNNSLNCSCVRACNYEDYNYVLSTSQWPNLGCFNNIATLHCTTDSKNNRTTTPTCKNMKSLSENNGTAEDKYFYLKNYFAKVHIYFKDIMYTVSEETVSYELVSFISDIGGTIGLWLGLSLFSLIEIIDLFISLCRIGLCKWKTT